MNKINGKAVAAACLFATAAGAQETAPNSVTFDVSQNLSYSNNLGFDQAERSGARAVTALAFGYNSSTRVQGFSFSASTNATFGTDDIVENGITDPVFRLSYNRESKNSGVKASVNFRQAEVSSIIGTQALIDAGFYTIDVGQQTDVGYSVSYDFGRTDPISGSLTYSGNSRDYTNTTDPDLLDTDQNTLAGELKFQLDPRITARAFAQYSTYEEESGFERNSSRYGVGADFAVTKTLSVNASVSQNEVERVENGVSTTTDGLGINMGVTQAVPDGQYTANVATTRNENGRRATLRLGRQMELKNGNLGLSFGGVSVDGDSFDPLYGITYAQELPRGAALSLEASQAFQTSSSGDEAINSKAALNYSTPVTAVSSLQASANYQQTLGIDNSVDDASRLDLSLSYRHELAEDWGLVGGYTRSFATDEGTPDIGSDTIFVGLQKRFEWRP